MRLEQEVKPKKINCPILEPRASRQVEQRERQLMEDPVCLFPVSPDQKQVFKVQVSFIVFSDTNQKSFKILLESL